MQPMQPLIRPTRHLREQKARALRKEKWIVRIVIGLSALGVLTFLTGCPGRWPINIAKGGTGTGIG